MKASLKPSSLRPLPLSPKVLLDCELGRLPSDMQIMVRGYLESRPALHAQIRTMVEEVRALVRQSFMPVEEEMNAEEESAGAVPEPFPAPSRGLGRGDRATAQVFDWMNGLAARLSAVLDKLIGYRVAIEGLGEPKREGAPVKGALDKESFELFSHEAENQEHEFDIKGKWEEARKGVHFTVFSTLDLRRFELEISYDGKRCDLLFYPAQGQFRAEAFFEVQNRFEENVLPRVLIEPKPTKAS